MIINGGSRAAPGQLAWHLQRRDTNERVEILELQSPAPTLGLALSDWQTLTEGTRGTKGLYHANIDPAKDYVMTREQWSRAVDVLEKELGLEGQPRAVIMHEKHGRQHIHVVWARTDIDRMILRSDSQNYLAHERASQRLEREFGHEPVPGKHAKRDRQKQPEFPKAEADQAEWQQGERTGLSPTARKDQITALKQASDNAQAFKTALEEQGYILAKGDRRDFVIVDEAGSIHSLGRQIRDMKAAELRAFMKDIDRETLPSAEEAKELQRQLRLEQQRRRDEKRRQGQQADTAKPAEADPQTKEAVKWAEHYEAQFKQHAFALEKMEFLVDLLGQKDKLAEQQAEMEALKERLREETSGLQGFIHATQLRWNPTVAAEETNARRQEIADLNRRLDKEYKDYLVLLEQDKALLRDEWKDRPAGELVAEIDGVRSKANDDLKRYIEERERDHRIMADYVWKELRQPQEQQKAQPQQPQQDQKLKQDQKQPEPQSSDKPPEPGKDTVQAEAEAIRKAHAERQEQERRRIIEAQKAEVDQLRADLDRNLRENLDRRDANNRRDADELRRQQKEERGLVDSVWSFLSPARAAELEAARQRERDELARRQQKERDDYAAFLRKANEQEIQQRIERHPEQLEEHAVKGEADLDRYLREQEAAHKLQAEVEEQERKREEERARDGPERPPPKRAR